MNIDETAYLAHYGILRKSGRYPWGSGETQEQRNKDFLSYVASMRKEGLTDTQIARGVGITTSQLRNANSIARNQQKQAQIGTAQRLHDKGMSNVAIGKQMGIPESTVRSLLKPGEKDKLDVLQSTANMLKEQVDKKGFIDVGTGVEHWLPLGITDTKFRRAVSLLEEQGYKVHSNIKVEQLGTGKYTNMKVLTPPGTTWGDVMKNRDKIRSITSYSDDNGRSWFGVKPPQNVSSKRIAVRYADQGGTEADGIIYLRPGVKDLSLGKSRYAQVRIAVDGTHYLKGMAMYKDDLPDGVDIMFNTNKSDTGNKLDAMKKLKTDKDGNIDKDNPFGAVLKPNGQRGALNIVNEEGDWEKWSKSLSTQMLSKQAPKLAKTQLDLTYERKKNELDEIMGYNNPTVRKKLLDSYADDVEASSVHLKAAALPNQASHVILPINTMKDGEIYAPNYRNGERVVLIRYPHGGIFEIPELTVNNKHSEARRTIGTNATDAVGISHKVAERLSGADFDGDTVLVIPNNDKKIKTAAALEGLKGFDPQRAYPAYEGMPKMSPRTKQTEMGNISNLITDMTIKGASMSELARAVRHSMVVIDAEKHNLNYKQSAIDNGISQLKEKYQNKKTGGASTLISNSGTTSTRVINARKPRSAAKGGPIDKATGKKVYEDTGESYIDKATGKPVIKTEKVARLLLTDDAHTLSSGTPIEKLYADHSNRLKALANKARLESVHTQRMSYSPAAKVAYSEEVASLSRKLAKAQKNAPLERQAQVLANAVYSQKLKDNPDMEAVEKKKIKSQALAEARARTGAKKQEIQIEDREWDAIQAGAITNHMLEKILNHADLDRIKELATPRSKSILTTAKLQRAQTMLASGRYTQAEVAQALGVSVSTLKSSLNGE